MAITGLSNRNSSSTAFSVIDGSERHKVRCSGNLGQIDDAVANAASGGFMAGGQDEHGHRKQARPRLAGHRHIGDLDQRTDQIVGWSLAPFLGHLKDQFTKSAEPLVDGLGVESPNRDQAQESTRHSTS